MSQEVGTISSGKTPGLRPVCKLTLRSNTNNRLKPRSACRCIDYGRLPSGSEGPDALGLELQTRLVNGYKRCSFSETFFFIAGSCFSCHGFSNIMLRPALLLEFDRAPATLGVLLWCVVDAHTTPYGF